MKQQTTFAVVLYGRSEVVLEKIAHTQNPVGIRHVIMVVGAAVFKNLVGVFDCGVALVGGTGSLEIEASLHAVGQAGLDNKQDTVETLLRRVEVARTLLQCLLRP